MQTTPTNERTIRDYMGLVLRGICMGASDIVPGVSGGTMAFILGVYEELINSIRTLGQPEFLQALVRFRFKEVFQILNWKFLLSIAIGIFTAVLTLSKGLEWLLLNQPVYLWAFFFGLVLASIYTVSKRIKKWTPSLWGILLVGAVAAYILVGLVPLQTPNAWWFLFISGALAICAMILPGISGAFILVLLGKYQFVLGSVNNFIDGLRAGDWAVVLQNFWNIAFVGAGAVIGLVTFAQIIGFFFKRYHDGTVAVLIGLMVGSLRKIWPWKEDIAWLKEAGEFVLDSDGHRIVIEQLNKLPNFSSSAGLAQFGLALLLAVIGFGAILLLDRLAGDQA